MKHRAGGWGWGGAGLGGCLDESQSQKMGGKEPGWEVIFMKYRARRWVGRSLAAVCAKPCLYLYLLLLAHPPFVLKTNRLQQ
mmetsp:Transcript_58254/g.85206  ORF Transcript_58254/g.85206 Transcript_58254/m.85206 type:complete len:82 (-) Transcript_58254:126-371(-)